jgi:hypothetical protein
MRRPTRKNGAKDPFALPFFWLLRGMRNSISTSSGVNTSVVVSDTLCLSPVYGDRCRAVFFSVLFFWAARPPIHIAVHGRTFSSRKVRIGEAVEER